MCLWKFIYFLFESGYVLSY
uniref:Uncharacterized protein n=1 Tax=Rhizophora mucronata TaxID=61149 RepID=A0A2P2J3L9_RHIMU